MKSKYKVQDFTKTQVLNSYLHLPIVTEEKHFMNNFQFEQYLLFIF